MEFLNGCDQRRARWCFIWKILGKIEEQLSGIKTIYFHRMALTTNSTSTRWKWERRIPHHQTRCCAARQQQRFDSDKIEKESGKMVNAFGWHFPDYANDKINPLPEPRRDRSHLQTIDNIRLQSVQHFRKIQQKKISKMPVDKGWSISLRTEFLRTRKEIRDGSVFWDHGRECHEQSIVRSGLIMASVKRI